MRVLSLKQGDREPALESVLRVGDDIIDLTGATVSLRYLNQYAPYTLYEKTATIVGDPTEGVARYEWQDGDTDEPGLYKLEWLVVLASGKPITVPNNSFDELKIFAALETEAETQNLLRQLRRRLGDSEGVIYPDDGALIQAMRDTYPDLLTGEIVTGIALGSDAGNPLGTTAVLTAQQSKIWVLVTAVELLEPEVLQAARVAASLRSPAGQMNITEVYKALQASLDAAYAALSAELSIFDGAGVKFLDLTSMDGRFVAAP